MNDASLIEEQPGLIHTWLKLDGEGKTTKYFSFSNSDNLSLVGIDSAGISSVGVELEKRKPSENVTIRITKQQYDMLDRWFDNFYTQNPKPNYDLTPDNEGDYNCVTAARTLLQEAGIYYLNNIQTPYGVGKKINGVQTPHNLERILSTRDDFDKATKEMIEYFEIFFDHGFNSKDIITRINFDSKRPITIPYGSRNEDFADFFLNYGGNLNKLHYAAKFGHIEIVRFTNENDRVLVSVKNANDNTPLHYAARYGHLKIVQYLIDEKQADLNVKNKVDMTPLHFAALGGHFKVAEYLVNKNRAYNIDSNICDNVYGATPLHYAASSGNYELVQFLLNSGASANQISRTGERPLHYAVSSGGNLRIVKLLIEKGAIISSEVSDTPTLHFAALGGHLDIVQYIINELHVDWNITSNGIHTLHFAVRGGNLSIVQYLIEQKQANVNVKDNIDGTPLHDAARRGYIDIVRYLLTKGAEKNAKNKLNESPLDSATNNRQIKVAEYLRSVQN